MSVTFTITFDYERFYTENELSEFESALRAKIAGAETIEGSIILATNGQPTIEIVDELLPWIQNLCFLGVTQLINGEDLHVNYFSRSGYVDLKLIDDIIEVRGNKIGNGMYPKSELLPALYNCGERFDTLIRKIADNNGDIIVNLDYMRRFAEETKDVLHTKRNQTFDRS